MPEPIISAANPPPIVISKTGPVIPPNGAAQEEPFGNQLETMLAQAFHEAKPDLYKAPDKPVQKPPEPPQLEPSRPTAKELPETPDKPQSPETKVPAKAAQWKEVNEERARLKAENEAFKAEKEKWKSWETERTEYDSVKKRNDELTKLVQEVALERDPDFRKHFDDRRNAALEIGKQIVGETHADTLKKIAQLPDGDFRNRLARDLLGELDELQKTELSPVLADIRKINFDRQAALQNAPDHLRRHEQFKQKQREERAQEFERTFKDVVDKWGNKDSGLPLFQIKDGDDAHNAEVKERIETARNILNMKLSADQLTKAALWSAAAPGLLKNQMALMEELKAIKAENEALKGGGPELKAGEEPHRAPDDDKEYEGLSYGEIIARKVQKAGGWQ